MTWKEKYEKLQETGICPDKMYFHFVENLSEEEKYKAMYDCVVMLTDEAEMFVTIADISKEIDGD